MLMTLALTAGGNLWALVDNSSQSNGRPYLNNGVWYSLYDEHQVGGVGRSDVERYLPLYAPTSGIFTWTHHNSNGIAKSIEVDAFYGGHWHNVSRSHNNNTNTETTDYIAALVWAEQLRIIYNGALATVWSKDIKLPMARHIRLEDGTQNGADQVSRTFTQTVIGQQAYVDIYMRSYLTDGAGITVTMTNGDENIFRLDNQAVRTKTIATAANECGMYNPTYADGSIVPNVVNANNAGHMIRICFVPNAAGTHTATFTVTNGTSLATITVSGEGVTSNHDFGTVEVDHSAADYTVANIGLSGTLASSDPVFTLDRTSVNEGESFTIGFHPTLPGSYTGTVTLTANGITYTYPVQGVATAHQTQIHYTASAHNSWTFLTNESNTIQLDIAANRDIWGDYAAAPDFMNRDMNITASNTDYISYNPANHTLHIIGNDPQSTDGLTHVSLICSYSSPTGRVVAQSCTIPVTIQEVPITMGIDQATLQQHIDQSRLNTATFGDNFVTDLINCGAITCNYSDVEYTVTQLSDNSIARLTGNQFYAYRHDRFVFRITAHSPLCRTDAVSADLSFLIPYGTMTFTNAAGDNLWSNPGNWTPERTTAPTDQQDVLINNYACNLAATNGIRECHDLTIANARLTISAGSALRANRVESTTAANLLLQADIANTATLVFAEGGPRATVESYFKGTINPLAGTGYRRPDWQYRGAIGTPDQITGWQNFYVYDWNEALNNTSSCWQNYQQGPNYTLTAWTGYCMDNDSTVNTTRAYTTTLIPAQAGHTYTLSRTHEADNKANLGNNLITNSFSAPINIGDIEFVNANAEVTFYETGSHADWETEQGQHGTQPGQFVTYPSEVAAAIAQGYSSYIPAGQSFFVTATQNNATVTVPARALVNDASGRMHAPKAEQNYNMLVVNLMEGDLTADRLVLIENEQGTAAYDNGYDGTKHFAGKGIPALYATTAFGAASVCFDTAIASLDLGFRAGQDTARYTLMFDNDRLEGYAELYVRDNLTGLTADILRGETLDFTGSTKKNAQRFTILGSRIIAADNATEADGTITVVDNRVMLDNIADDVDIRLIDMQGRVLMSRKAYEGREFTLPELTKGVYVITAGNESVKIIR